MRNSTKKTSIGKKKRKFTQYADKMTKLLFLIALHLNDFPFLFREAAAHVDPTPLTRPSKDINHLGPSYNNTAKLSPNNWTFNKTVSNLIRQTHHNSPQISRVFSHSRKRSLS